MSQNMSLVLAWEPALPPPEPRWEGLPDGTVLYRFFDGETRSLLVRAGARAWQIVALPHDAPLSTPVCKRRLSGLFRGECARGGAPAGVACLLSRMV